MTDADVAARRDDAAVLRLMQRLDGDGQIDASEMMRVIEVLYRRMVELELVIADLTFWLAK